MNQEPIEFSNKPSKQINKLNLDERVATVLTSNPVEHITYATAVVGGTLWCLTTHNPDNFFYNVTVTAIAGLGVTLCLVRSCAANFLAKKQPNQRK